MVAHGVAIAVIDLFEVVEVQHQQGHGQVLAPRALQAVAEQCVGGVVVEAAGEAIHRGQAAHLLRHALEAGQQEAKRRAQQSP